MEKHIGTYLDIIYDNVKFDINDKELEEKINSKRPSCIEGEFVLFHKKHPNGKAEANYIAEGECAFDTELLRTFFAEHLVEGSIQIEVGGGYDLNDCEPYTIKIVPGKVIPVKTVVLSIPDEDNQKEIDDAIKYLNSLRK
jgi:hypothetical protein